MDESVLKKYVFGEKEEMEQLSDFLEYGGLSHAVLRYEEDAEENEAYYIEIDKKEENQARKLTSVFYKEWDKKQKKENEDSELEVAQDAVKEEPTPASFIKASDKAENYRSSAFALLIVGVLGVIVMILIAAGVIPVYLAPNIRVLSFITMLFLFLVFIVMGCKSLADAKKYEKMSEEEEQTTNNLQSWFLGQYTKETLDGAAGISDTDKMEEEMKYFKRSETMKELINARFGEQEASFLEKNIEDLYTELYEH